MTSPLTPQLGILTANIGNPSLLRAERQLAWLATRPEHILVLTETADSVGCALLAERFTGAGHTVAFPTPTRGERGVMIISRAQTVTTTRPLDVGFLPHRAVSLAVGTDAGTVEVIGLYVPSRDAGAAKTERKRLFIQACRDHLPGAGDDLRLIVGDFNILEPDHNPRYRIFQPFEYDFYRWFATAGYTDAWRSLNREGDPHYSWVGRTGDGYRYDHAFTSAGLHSRLIECEYVDDPRTGKAALSDHSALSVRLALATDELLLVSDPTVSDQQALF
ncbi:hypothetical protein KGQ19_15965 [Catenulispora sp. NL8]|uniref:Endonuclease/exonuclease/phosphatase domain-containing protein n=1 Tax=Catenulispora pinistramenti TaxID=2705254 RepID=A0ABS5KQN9_9ACTN|nr:endonuclease/exonuclease/phosphatase family protein [Catenulispora pinistramenti]MBS2548362.1 hypothetical protein [Catenulispora pinistramenti]